ncbi:MAG: deoxyribonuclease IV [bacterium]
MIIGSHVSMNGKEMMLGSVKEAINYGATAFMIYTGAPQNTARKKIEELRIEEAHQLMSENNIDLKNVVVHAPYIVNPGTFLEDKRDFAISFLTEEVKRTYAMGSKILVLHPGNTLKNDLTETIKNIAFVINKINDNTKDLDVVIALETMSGKGTEVGRNFKEVKQIIDLINDKKRIGVCLDTCHIHDSGYDLVNDYDGVKKEFDTIIGLKYLNAIHLNDSKNVMGAQKDRHENLGVGNIGLETLLKVCYDEDFANIPKILETPYIDGVAPYKEEIKIIRNKGE